jgi:hypothetical protein
MTQDERVSAFAQNVQDLYENFCEVGGWVECTPEEELDLKEYVENMLTVWEAIITDGQPLVDQKQIMI